MGSIIIFTLLIGDYGLLGHHYAVCAFTEDQGPVSSMNSEEICTAVNVQLI